jgi:succinyl-diaminopimelate desuccinylase
MTDSVTTRDEATINDVVSLLSDLVAIPSINPAFRSEADPTEFFGEQAKAEYVLAWLRRAGVAVHMQEVLPGRPNVLAEVRGRDGCKTLMLECHLDTVQVTGMDTPFTPILRDGRLHGRGAVDDGGCVVAMMLAMRALQRDPPDCTVVFVAAIDEEFKYRGIAHALAQGVIPDGGIAGEPTELRVVSACKGCVRWRIEVFGRAAHSSEPSCGIDAIAIATDLLTHLRRVLEPKLALRHHPLVGSPTLVCSMIEGGQGPNTVAERCVLTFDRRTLPGESGLDAWREAQAEVAVFTAAAPTDAHIIVHPPFIDSVSMAANAEADIVTTARAVCRAAGLSDTIEGVAFGSDASKMDAVGIPTIVFGPGSIAQAHTAGEYVAVADVARAASMIEDMARGFGRQ